MCGISGIFSKDKNISFDAAIRAMNVSQSRRGPDDEGFFVDKEKGVALGHRRLSIIDLSSDGHQPMQYKQQATSNKQQATSNKQQGELWITFNGEIYNFLELKKELEDKGYVFRTKTDTEIILVAYVECGTQAFEKLRGMFAFALWDAYEKKLFLVKDRYGIKPLYYYSDREKLVFASTVKAIKKSGIAPAEKNPQAFIGFLLFGSVPLPMTTIKNVLAVPAGHYLVRESDGNQKLVQYYDSINPFLKENKLPTTNYQLLTTHVRSLLEESINLHLISDAPLGVFLSGGLDSSVIAALAAQQRKDPITTLSIIFDEPEFSEQKYQLLVAQKIGSDHREVKITQKDFYDSFDDIFDAMDQPTIDGVNTFFISQAAKKAGLKVVLSGLGSDEIFCGYSHFRKAAMLRKFQSIFGHYNIFSSAMAPITNLLGNSYKKLNYFFNNDILSFYLGIRGLFTPQETAKILDINESEVKKFIEESNNSLLITHYSLLKSLHPIDLLSYLELKFYLQNQLLKDTDFMAMYHSIEARVPFLDHLLVEYMSNVSPRMKLGNGINKQILAETVRDILPQEIFTRPKMGFTFPFAKWMKEIPGIQQEKEHWSRAWASYVLSREFGINAKHI